jgi:spore coat polysaccharide biosynthesis predicted glycosyltransferase SpsG
MSVTTRAPRSLVLRADATAATGAGHVMRGAALAAAWREAGGTASLWGSVEIPFVRARLEALGVPVAADARAGTVLVVDSYDADVRRGLAGDAAYELRVLVDDLGGPVPAGYDVVWNPNPAADAARYPAFDGTVLAGARHVALPATLPRWAPAAAGDRSAGDRRRVGVLLGGGAPPSALVSALAAAGAALPDHAFAGGAVWAPAGWTPLEATGVWSALATCDVLVTAGGTTMLEAAAVGIPAVVLQVADNQRANADWARAAGVPVLAATTPTEVASVADMLGAAMDRARPLPRLENGAPAVVRTLVELVTPVDA